MSSLRELALRGTLWTLIGYGISQLIRLGGNIVLTRLLAPELFGLMATVTTLIVALNFLSDAGLSANVIQHSRGDDPNYLNTVWTIQMMRGFVLWLGCSAIAWPVAQLYDDRRLLWLLPLVSLTCLLGGFNSTSLMTLNRRVALKEIMLLDLALQILSLTIVIVWAWLSPTVWALVAGNLSGSAAKVILSYRLIPNYSNRLAWEPEAVRDIISFGKWIFVSTAFTFLATQTDRLLLAKFTSFEMLGIYTIAYTLALLPQSIIGMLASRVLLPVFSQLSDLPRENFRLKLLNNRRWLLLMLSCPIVLLVCFGDELILVLYDPRYHQAAWMLPILALGIWPNVLVETNRQALTALGKLSYQAYGQMLKALHMCLGLFIGFHLFGLPGFIITVALNDLESYAAIGYGLWREQLGCFQQDLSFTLGLMLAIALLLTLRAFWGFGSPIDLIW